MQEITSLTFEQAFRELEQIVQQLEKGELPLEQTLALFQRGTALARLCQNRLDAAEQQVSLLSEGDGVGPVLTPFREEE